MSTNSVRGATLKYKNLIPAGPSADAYTNASTATNAVPPPLPGKKPLLPVKPTKKPESFVNPVAMLSSSQEQDSGLTGTTPDHYTRTSVLYVRPKSERYSKVREKGVVTPAEEQLNSVFERASLSAAAVCEPSISLPVVGEEYVDLNTKENRKRILELHAGFNGVTFNYIPVEDKGRRRHPNIVDVYEPMTISLSVENGPKDMLRRILVREGPMEKLNRQHQFERYHFIMTHDALIYCEVTVKVTSLLDSIRNLGSPDHSTSNPLAVVGAKDKKKKTGVADDEKLVYHRTLPFHTIMVAPPEESCPYNQKNTFRILSSQKSFYVRCNDAEEKDSWFSDLERYIRLYQAQCIRAGKIEAYLEECNTAPMRVSHRSDITDCQVCLRAFGLFDSKHHCRNCGKCVCEVCSREKIRIERIDKNKLFKVCSTCARELKSSRRYGVQAYTEADE